MSAVLTRSVVYNKPANASQGKVHLYVKRGAPVVVLIQHGGWMQVDSRDAYMVPWIDELYDRGLTVVGLNWRFAPAWQYPVALFDIDLAIRVAHRHLALLYQRDHVTINLLGFSSGAHLAALWTLNRPTYSRDRFDPRLNVKSVVTMAGPYNLGDGALNVTARAFVNGFIPDPVWQAAASPITYAPLAGAMKTHFYLYHGMDDDLVPHETQAVAMYDALSTAGANVTMRAYPGIGHEIGQYTSPNWAARAAQIVADLIAL